jgi:hypothetical protein
MITLSENEERLVETFRLLTPASADEVIAWINRLRKLGNGKGIDWSDSWSEEDIVDLQRASMAEFDSGEREEL